MLDFKGGTCHGSKNKKERMTVFAFCKAGALEKFP